MPRLVWDDDLDRPTTEESTYPFAEHGPAPAPAWLITGAAATQHDLGVLKTGKEADVVLVERELGSAANLLAAKRYRDTHHRSFRNDAVYRRGTGDERVNRALASGSRFGMAARASLWAANEMATLCRLWAIGVPVPYPVQLLGTEVMLEYIGDADGAAPRLVNAPPGSDLSSLCDQAVEAFERMTWDGVVHGDLSPFNLLVWDGRLVVIDVPQAIQVDDHPNGLDLLHRDVVNVIGWFARRGMRRDPEEVFGDLVSIVYDPTRVRGDRSVERVLTLGD